MRDFEISVDELISNGLCGICENVQAISQRDRGVIEEKTTGSKGKMRWSIRLILSFGALRRYEALESVKPRPCRVFPQKPSCLQ